MSALKTLGVLIAAGSFAAASLAQQRSGPQPDPGAAEGGPHLEQPERTHPRT